MAKTSTKKASTLPPKEEWKFDIATLAGDLGIKGASARVALRKHKIKKGGKSYGWNSRAEYDDVLKRLKADAKKAA